MTIQSLPYTLLLSFLFGSTLIASRFSVGQFHPTIYIGLRLSLASLGYVAYYTLGQRRRPWPTDSHLWRHAALFGILGTALPMTAIVMSLQYQSSGVTSMLITTGPAVTVFLAHFFLPDETLTRRKIVGTVLSLAGTLLLAVRGETGLHGLEQASPLGYGLALLGVFATSGMTIYARRFMRDFDAFHVTSIRVFAAGLAVMPLSVLFLGLDLRSVNSQGFFALGYAALAGTFFAQFLAFYIVKRFGATTFATTHYITPVVAGLGGILILEEHITTGMVAGVTLIALGIVLINRQHRA